MNKPSTGIDESFWQIVGNVIDYSVLILDPEGRIERCTPGAERITGYSASEVIGRNFSIFYRPEDIASGQPARELGIAAREERFEENGWRIRKDGVAFWANIITSAVRSADGTLLGYVKLTRDTTDPKRMAEQLGDVQEMFRRVFDAAPNPMIMVTTDGSITMMNTEVRSAFGYSVEELIGRRIETLVPERFRAAHPVLRGGFAATPQARPMGAGRDLYALRKDGTEFPVEIGLTPIDTESGKIFLTTIVDITGRKQEADRILAALKEKDILLGEIHHRVKNNLQVIHSLLDLQSSRITDPVAITTLRESQNRIRSIALIHQLLYQSKDYSRVDFRTVLQTLIPPLLIAQGMNYNVTFEIIAEDIRLPLNVAVPCGLIVNELATNVLKHAFPDGRTGKMTILLNADDQGEISIAVNDDGVGIDDSLDITQIGTLGLQLIQLLSEQIGGTLTINRRDPTSFRIAFKVAD